MLGKEISHAKNTQDKASPRPGKRGLKAGVCLGEMTVSPVD